MGTDSSRYDVCVVGGAGHIGAPLAILLADKGLRTVIYDVNTDAVNQIASGLLPFYEEDGQEILQRVIQRGGLSFSSEPNIIRNVPNIIVTIGTPIDEFHNPKLSVVTECVDAFLPFLSDAQTLILRSTVFPGVTDFLARYLAKKNKNPKIAFCPERVVQGQAFKEILSLPQIVSGTTPEAEESATNLFSRLAPSIVRMLPQEAEFAKLICNAYRYIQFAAANQFYTMAESAGMDYHRILNGVQTDYPRAATLPGPGFAAGPCLMKDTMQLFAFSNNKFQLGQTAMTINESLPNFIVENLKRDHDLRKSTVGILGMAFKGNIDDKRDSLSYKLHKILSFEGARVLCSDEHIRNDSFVSKETIKTQCDIVVIGAPHAEYKNLRIPPDKCVVDLWGICTRVDEHTAALRIAS